MTIEKHLTMVLMKPSHGEGCNRCGLCCTLELCEVAQAVFDRPDRRGPCPALLGDIGTASCGMIDDPTRFAPSHVAEHGVAAMSHAAGVMINAGQGCDCRVGGEPVNQSYEIACRMRRVRDDAEVKKAMRLWRLI